jgi:hypothetical protein
MPPTLLLRPPSFRLPVSSRRANSASSYVRTGPNSSAEPPSDGMGATAAKFATSTSMRERPFWLLLERYVVGAKQLRPEL